MKEIELLIRKNALKDVEIWLNQQYQLIDDELAKLKKAMEASDEQ